jgi:hypothetical protein
MTPDDVDKEKKAMQSEHDVSCNNRNCQNLYLRSIGNENV